MEKKKAGCGTFILSWVIATVLMAVALAEEGAFTAEGGEWPGGRTAVAISVVLGGFIMACLIVLVRMVKWTIEGSIAEKQRRKKDEQEGISRYSTIHVGGLAAPENCRADVVLSPIALTVNCAGSEYVLKIEKIRSVNSQLDVNEVQYLESSAARGVIGAVLFGTSGAVIGSAPRTKTKIKIKGYAIISYEDAQGEHKAFLLRDAVENSKNCSRLVDDLQPRINQQINRVEL